MTQTREIWFQVNSKGQRKAFYFSRLQFRAFPIAAAKAELLIATGQAVQIPGHPFPRA